MDKKKRLDVILHELYPQYSRNQIQGFIMQGKVTMDGRVITKSGAKIRKDFEAVEVVLDLQVPKYVSRAGFKLEKALDYFKIDVKGLVVLDSGLSAGGFADCLVQRGAKKVYGVDVGYGQTHEKIRNDPRVIILEKTNLRDMRDLGEKVDLITLDLSFISVLKVMDAVKSMLKASGHLIVLIKPQFEAERRKVGRGGIVKDDKVHAEVLDNVVKGVKKYHLEFIGWTDSPIYGASGNKEFLAYFKNV